MSSTNFDRNKLVNEFFLRKVRKYQKRFNFGGFRQKFVLFLRRKIKKRNKTFEI